MPYSGISHVFNSTCPFCHEPVDPLRSVDAILPVGGRGSLSFKEYFVCEKCFDEVRSKIERLG